MQPFLSSLLKPRLFAWARLIFLFPLSAGAQVFVTPSGAGAQNGSSWGNAYSASALRTVLANAASGSVIWVAQGTYKPAVTGRDTSFFIKPGIKVYGGFNGTETALNQRNPQTNVTTLSGDVGVSGDSTDNSYHVVTFLNADSATLLDGFVITRGQATGTTFNAAGGGILNLAQNTGTGVSAPIIHACIIRLNNAFSGGGCYNTAALSATARPVFDNCLFENNASFANSGTRGGGAFCSEAAGGQGTVTYPFLIGCAFQNNTAVNDGGAIALVSNGRLNKAFLKNCLIKQNTALQSGGGLKIFNDSGRCDITIDSTVFQLNGGFNGAGAMAVQLVSGTGASTVSVLHSSFENNAGLATGAIRYTSTDTNRGSLRLVNSIFRRNHATGGGQGAVGIYSLNNSTDTSIILNSLFYNNYETGGTAANNAVLENGSAYNGKNTVLFLNSTMYNDSLTATPVPAGAQVLNSGTVSTGFTNTLTTFYSVNSIIWMASGTPKAVRNNPLAVAYVENSILRGSGGSAAWVPSTGINLGGNMDVYPAFTDTATGRLDLRCNSLGVNAGDNLSINPYVAFMDLRGNPRIVHNVVDIGAFENQFVPVLAAPAITASGATVLASSASTGPIDSLRWSFGDGTAAASDTASTQTHTYTHDGNYTVCLHLFSSCGNMDSCTTVHITGLGIGAAARAGVQVYPNPAQNRVRIKNLPAKATICIYSTGGSLVYTDETGSPAWELDTRALPAGVYYLRIADKVTGAASIQKLTIMR